MAGTALLCSGASALNQYLERDADARMHRTRRRPIPAGRMRPEDALLFGLALSAAGLAALAPVNALTLALARLSLVSYVLAYTPLKRVTSLCTVVGAVPGALPPLMGWTAARGVLGPAGWALFAILFLWQLPHFLAIGWLYREDYARGGFPMLGRHGHRRVLDRPPGAALRRRAPARDARRRPARRRRQGATSGVRSRSGRRSSCAPPGSPGGARTPMPGGSSSRPSSTCRSCSG